MHIVMRIPYDEARLRRTLQLILRPQVRAIRILGGVLIALGLVLAVLTPSDALVYVAILLGLWWAVGAGPAAVGRSLRMQSNAVKDHCLLALDDEWITLTYPLAESRRRWIGIDRVAETDDAWYVMFGKRQAFAIPKDLMTAEQRAEFAAFVSDRQLAGKQPPVLDGDRHDETDQAGQVDRLPKGPAVRPPTSS
jgi:hypothetical protein